MISQKALSLNMETEKIGAEVTRLERMLHGTMSDNDPKDQEHQSYITTTGNLSGTSDAAVTASVGRGVGACSLEKAPINKFVESDTMEEDRSKEERGRIGRWRQHEDCCANPGNNSARTDTNDQTTMDVEVTATNNLFADQNI